MNETNLIEDLRLLAPPSYGGALALAATAIVGAVLVLVLRRRTRGGPAAVADPDAVLRPWDLALAALEQLSPLLRTDRSREYAIAATLIVRRYIEARYDLHAPRLTTEEFLRSARSAPALPPADQTALGDFLARCDLCKFGRFVAALEELRELQAAAVAFVLRSRPGIQVALRGPSPG